MSRDIRSSSPTASVALLGTDAVLAALPATPVQLAHACRALGYDMAFPASWGDELVAEACLARVGTLSSEPAILCTCPHVARRLATPQQELAPWLLTLPAPPVAAARYLRAAYGDRAVHITFVGECPAGDDPDIDARLLPAALFAQFAEQDIVLAEQPEFFDSRIPPDRRRFHSVPGGAPSAERLAEADPRRTLVELEADDYPIALAECLLAQQRTLVDLAPQLGCTCSGVLVAGAAHGVRGAVAALEPPRAGAPVLDPTVHVDLTPPRAPRYAPARPPAAPPAVPEAPAGTPGGPAAREADAGPAAPALRRADGAWVPRAFARFARRIAAPAPPGSPEPPRRTSGAADERAHSPVIPLGSAPRPVPPPPARHAVWDDAVPETCTPRS